MSKPALGPDAPTARVTSRPTTAAELLRVSGGDVFVRCELRAGADGTLLGPAWSGEQALVFSRRGGGRDQPVRMTAVGPAGPAAALLVLAASELPRPPAAITVPRGALPLLPAQLRPPAPEDWDWFWTTSDPPAVPGERHVAELPTGERTAEELRAVLPAWSPRYSGEPGSPYVRRWCAVRDERGELLAVAAHVEYVPGVPHLASIATAPAARGRGLGAAVTAWLTRRALAERGICTMGMYADNAVARRLYRRLGYTDSHHWTSGTLATAAAGTGSARHSRGM